MSRICDTTSLMDRRRFLLTSLAGAFAAPLGGQAQRPSGTLPRVGWLGAGPAFNNPDLVEAFREGLREPGYVEGQNVIIEYRWAEQRYDRLPRLAAELVHLGVNVIFAGGDLPAAGARQTTATIPIVFTGATDPVASKFIVSLAHPGGNMTGLTQTGTQVTGKRVSLLKEARPKLSRIALLSNPDAFPIHLRAAHDAARALGLQAQTFEVRRAQDFEGVFLAMVKDRAQALVLVPDSVFYQERGPLGQLALRHRLPMIGWRPDFAREGALLAYGAPITEDFRRAGVLVGKILNGAKPSDLPVEEPSNLKLFINLKTAKALGLTIPPSLLLRADQIIE
jgi:putative ABC transport system substrate-binding protein